MHSLDRKRLLSVALIFCALAPFAVAAGIAVWPTAMLSVVQKYLRPHQAAMYRVAAKLVHSTPLPEQPGPAVAGMRYSKIADDRFQLEEQLFFRSRLVLKVRIYRGGPMYAWYYYPNPWAKAEWLYAAP